MSYLLDTNICIYLFKGAGSVETRINQVGISTCFLSEITIAELMFGVENSAPDRRFANQANLEWLYQAFTGRVLSIRHGLPVYAQQKARLRRAGRPVGEFDLLIGATAIAHNLTLVTRNTRDFVNLDSIRLENWIDA